MTAVEPLARMHCIKLPFLLMMLFWLIGCTKSTPPPELSAVQGAWQFDEATYLSSLRTRFKDPEELKKVVAVYQTAKRNGTPVMTDITISGSRITTGRGSLRQQYDLSDLRPDNGRVTATALWHEDINDPGDASTISIILQTNGANLVLTLSEDGSEDAYSFKRK